MAESFKRADFDAAYESYFDSVYRFVFIYIRNPDDTLDTVQEVFFKFLICEKPFDSEEHKKRWLMKCAYNAAMDYFRAKWRKAVPLDELIPAAPFEIDETVTLVLGLKEKYRAPIYMYYYEGYQADEIASLLSLPAATVRTRLKRGRELLKKKLEEGGASK